MHKNRNNRAPSRFVNLLFLICACACFWYYLANGVFIRFNQSLLFLWPIIGCALFARWALVRRTIKTGKPSPLPRAFLRAMHALILLALVFFFAVEGVILSGAFQQAPQGLDYIIVLGAKVDGTQPSGALRNRIQRAAEYMAENPDTVLIASGGQGDDEGISEAQCILNGLTERGIDPARVILENASTSTKENLQFSLAMFNAAGADIGIVTNNFHIYRALKIANAQGDFHFYGIPVSTSAFGFPHYMLREFAALVVGGLSGDY